MSQNHSIAEQRSEAWAQTFAAAPPIRELAEIARAALAESIPEEAVRARVKEHAESVGLASWRFLFPSLNRRALRYPFPKLLHKLADHYASKTRHRTLREFIESFTSKIGFDDWIVDSALSMARTGEPLPMAERLFGGVHVQRMTFGGDDPYDVVMLVAGPASDFEALADEFLVTCARTFPAASWQRTSNELRDASWFRAFHEGTSDVEIAWNELANRYPGEIVHENPVYADEHRRLVAQIKQARKRHFDRVTGILESPSPDSEVS